MARLQIPGCNATEEPWASYHAIHGQQGPSGPKCVIFRTYDLQALQALPQTVSGVAGPEADDPSHAGVQLSTDVFILLLQQPQQGL